jgi:hypothetical protein
MDLDVDMDMETDMNMQMDMPMKSTMLIFYSNKKRGGGIDP